MIYIKEATDKLGWECLEDNIPTANSLLVKTQKENEILFEVVENNKLFDGKTLNITCEQKKLLSNSLFFINNANNYLTFSDAFPDTLFCRITSFNGEQNATHWHV